MLVGLLSAARDALAHDLDAADRCLSRATALLEADAPFDSRATPACQGGLAPWQVHRLKAYVEDNLAGSLEAADLAATVRLSAGHFARAFKSSFGAPPHAYITAQRVEQAKLRMSSTTEPLAEIALSCGFSDQPHFCRLFRQATGETPGHWRRRHVGPR
ncbi:MAG: AraC family transcriptional regulator [Caulobacteraceae bacterium]